MPNQFSHPWLTKDLEVLQKKFTTMQYEDLRKLLGRSYSSVQSKIRNLHVNKRIQKYSIDTDFFKSWSANMAYILGFITADGNVQNKKSGYHIHIACDDRDVIEKIRNVLKAETPIREKPRFNGKISYSLRFSDKTIFYDLVKLGITPQKSLTIIPPFIPKIYFWHYIRGFFDGDGCVNLKKSIYSSKLNVYFYTGSIPLMQFLYKNLIFYLPLYIGHPQMIKRNAYTLHFGQRDSEIIFQHMYKDAEIFMERKYNIFLKGLLWK